MPKKKEGTSVKKAAPKKATSKKNVALKAAPEEYAFVTLDGKRLRTILELAHELDDMADHVFAHHVNSQKNDFANWVRDVFAEEALAQQIAQATDKHHTHIVVLRHIVEKLPSN